MAVELLEKTYQEPKELGEVLRALEGILGDMVGKGTSAEKITKVLTRLPEVMSAVEGYEKVGDELKSGEVYEAGGAFVGRVVKLLSK